MSDITKENFFAKLSKLSVKDRIERKGNASYLSWAWAIEILKGHDPEASWTFKTFDGLPYQKVPGDTCLVWCELSAFGRTFTPQWLPVMDNRNKAIANPDAFAVNTALMRCLVKAIAVHTGLGLSLYYGEDVPRDAEATSDGMPAEEVDGLLNAIAAASNKESLDAVKTRALARINETGDTYAFGVVKAAVQAKAAKFGKPVREAA